MTTASQLLRLNMLFSHLTSERSILWPHRGSGQCDTACKPQLHLPLCCFAGGCSIWLSLSGVRCRSCC